MRVRWVIVILVAVLVASGCNGSDVVAPPAFADESVSQPDQPAVPASGDGETAPLVRLVSIPDFLNSDIDMSLTVPGGSPPQMVEVINFTMDAIVAEEPDAVLVAGDLLNSRWHLDRTETYYFGPVGSLSEKEETVTTAAAAYYPGWRNMFDSRDLVVYPAIGDHELGDNDWPPGHHKSQLVPTYRANFARHLLSTSAGDRRFDGYLFDGAVRGRPADSQWQDTAYAVVHGDTLVVTLDVFSQDSPNERIHPQTGSVLGTVEGTQLEWLRELFVSARASGTIRDIIVQGHAPILTRCGCGTQASSPSRTAMVRKARSWPCGSSSMSSMLRCI